MTCNLCEESKEAKLLVKASLDVYAYEPLETHIRVLCCSKTVLICKRCIDKEGRISEKGKQADPSEVCLMSMPRMQGGEYQIGLCGWCNKRDLKLLDGTKRFKPWIDESVLVIQETQICCECVKGKSRITISYDREDA